MECRLGKHQQLNALNKCLLFMQFLNKEIQSPVAWSTTQSHFGFSSDLSGGLVELGKRGQSDCRNGALVLPELLYGKQLKKKQWLKKKTKTEVEDAEENLEEIADVEQDFNNLSTMSLGKRQQLNALNKCLLFMQFLNKEIQSPVAWSTTQSHFGFSSDLSEFGQNLVNKSQSALSKSAHVCRALKNRVITKPAYARAAIRKTTQEEAAKEKTTTEVEDAEENLEETADVEQAFNNLSTMSFLNIYTRSKTTQTAKGRLAERKQLEQAKKNKLQEEKKRKQEELQNLAEEEAKTEAKKEAKTI
ncbi:hypothetical protein Tco_0317296 [Tanacetum coccineum]